MNLADPRGHFARFDNLRARFYVKGSDRIRLIPVLSFPPRLYFSPGRACGSAGQSLCTFLGLEKGGFGSDREPVDTPILPHIYQKSSELGQNKALLEAGGHG